MRDRVSVLVFLFAIAGCSDGEAPALDAPIGDAESDVPTPTNDALADAQVEDTIVEPGRDASTATDAADASDGYPLIVVGKITGAVDDEPAMIAEGVTLVNETMKTACFHDYVLSASWTETNGLTQAQIYDKLCSGPVTVDVDMFTGSWYQNHVTHTVGYENEPGTVHMNRYFVNTAYMVADNLIHEGEGHSQGFHHDGVKATSVPYGLNAAFEACSPVKP